MSVCVHLHGVGDSEGRMCERVSDKGKACGYTY